MFVNDRTEIGTMECRPSSIPCGLRLNNRERSDSVVIVKPAHIRPRVSQILQGSFTFEDMHNLCLARYILC